MKPVKRHDNVISRQQGSEGGRCGLIPMFGGQSQRRRFSRGLGAGIRGSCLQLSGESGNHFRTPREVVPTLNLCDDIFELVENAHIDDFTLGMARFFGSIPHKRSTGRRYPVRHHFLIFFHRIEFSGLADRRHGKSIQLRTGTGQKFFGKNCITVVIQLGKRKRKPRKESGNETTQK